MTFQTNYEVVPAERELPDVNVKTIFFRGNLDISVGARGFEKPFTHWLKAVPESIVTTKDDLIKIISEAWNAGVERFCFDNGSEFVEGIPATKQTYINSIIK